MTIINIGTEINLEKFMETRGLIQANSGGGKSYTARRLAEEAYGKVQIVIFDIAGEYHTLREKYDFLLIGDEDADVQISLKLAEALPKKLVEYNVSTIIDMSSLRMGDRIKFVRNFLENLIELPKKYWKPLLLFIEEAHKLCGQQEKQESATSVIDVMSMGRKMGICGVLITQRIAKLHKDAAAEANNKFVGRTFIDVDMKRAADELGFRSKDKALELRELEPGEMHAFGVAIKPHYVHKIKINKAKTTHPKVGSKKLETKPTPPTPKIKEILSKLAKLPQEREKELRELNDYKKEIARLKIDLSKRDKGIIDPEKIKEERDRAYQKGIEYSEKTRGREFLKIKKTFEQKEAQLRKLQEQYNHLQSLNQESQKFSKAIQKITSIIEGLSEGTIKFKNNSEIKVKEGPTTIKGYPKKTPEFSVSVEWNKLSSAEKKTYKLFIDNPTREFTRNQIALLSGYSPGSGHFSNILSGLRTKGLIHGDGNQKVSISQSNLDPSLVEDIKEDMKLSLDLIRRKLGSAATRLLDILIREKEISREELAIEGDYSPSSGHYSNTLSKLNTLRLIKKEDNGSTIKLNPEIEEFI